MSKSKIDETNVRNKVKKRRYMKYTLKKIMITITVEQNIFNKINVNKIMSANRKLLKPIFKFKCYQ